jgi:hypothetical protein
MTGASRQDEAIRVSPDRIFAPDLSINHSSQNLVHS